MLTMGWIKLQYSLWNGRGFGCPKLTTVPLLDETIVFKNSSNHRTGETLRIWIHYDYRTWKRLWDQMGHRNIEQTLGQNGAPEHRTDPQKSRFSTAPTAHYCVNNRPLSSWYIRNGNITRLHLIWKRSWFIHITMVLQFHNSFISHETNQSQKKIKQNEKK